MVHSDSDWLFDGLKLLFSGRRCRESYMALVDVLGLVYMALSVASRLGNTPQHTLVQSHNSYFRRVSTYVLD